LCTFGATLLLIFLRRHFDGPKYRAVGYRYPLIGGFSGATSLGKIASGRSFQVSDNAIFLDPRKRFVKASDTKLPFPAGEPSGRMKMKEAKPLVVAAWDEWVTKRGLDCDDTTGRDTLQFYCELQDAESPLLNFTSRARDKWYVIHDWLVSAQRVRS
jgi:hypothetical protein